MRFRKNINMIYVFVMMILLSISMHVQCGLVTSSLRGLKSFVAARIHEQELLSFSKAIRSGDLEAVDAYVQRQRESFNINTVLCAEDAWDDLELSQTPLLAAVAHNRPVIVRYLCEHGACDTSSRCILYGSPLHEAAIHGYDVIASILMEYQHDIAYQDAEYGSTPLHRAVIGSHVSTVQLLLKKHPEAFELRSSSGNTPLHSAVKCKKRDIVQLLIAHGAAASIDIHNDAGLSCLDIARQNGDSDMVQILEKAASMQPGTSE